MGLLDIGRSLDRRLTEWATGRRMLTPSQVWGSGGTWRPLGSAGIDVTTEAAMQAAIGACVRLLADDISALPVDVLRKEGDASVPSSRPNWLEHPTPRRFETFQMHTSDVLVSLLTDGNAFIRCYPSTLRPENFVVLDPTTVTVKEKEDRSVVFANRFDRELTDLDIIHIPWIRLPGKLRGLSVLEASSSSSGLEIAARQWAGEFFANGGTLGNVIEFPPGPSPNKETLEAIRDSMVSEHVGRGKAWKLGMLTGGAKLNTTALRPAEADLSPLWRHVLEEAARLYHIPPHLLASQESGASSYASVEHRSIEYVVHAVVPVVTRLEHVYSRLVGRDRFIKFNVSALLRGDIKTRAEAWSFFLQSKVVTPAYVAAKEDFPPDQAAGGWLETPNNNGPREAAPAAAPSGDRADPVNITVTSPPVNVTTPPVSVTSFTTPDATDKAERAADLMVADNRQLAEMVELAVAESNQATRDYVEARTAALEEAAARAEAQRAADMERLTAISPVSREVARRDDNGRPLLVIERRGDVEVRKVVERDEQGRIKRVIEVPAA